MNMVNISEKENVPRRAVARGVIRLGEGTADAIFQRQVKKGDVLETARCAGMLAVKSVPSTIPHCHNIPINGIDFEFERTDSGVACSCAVSSNYRTGVEMEALAGVTAALLVIWDMVKYLEKDENGQYPDTAITDVRVVSKLKGASE